MKKTRKPKPVIGWREWIGLPGLGVKSIKVKVDTGARTSSLHVYELSHFRRRGVKMVRFKIHPLQRNSKLSVSAEAEIVDQREIRSSSGHVQERLVVQTSIRYLDEEWPIELTLTSRDQMGFRMLLGREAIRGRFTVDPGKSFFGGRPARIKKRKPSRS